MSTQSAERFEISLKTPAGDLSTSVDVPTAFIPVTAIVPFVQRLGDEAQTLEERVARDAGAAISCAKGCAACCRMLVPVSAPEAFALQRHLRTLPEERRRHFERKLDEASAQLERAGLLDRLMEVAESDRQLTDEDVEPLNRDYYALRMPCPFLDEELCGIYEHRPSACRELLVTTPAELCLDLAKNPVQPLPVSVRMSTALGLLWSELAGGPARLIPLPVALRWAERHEQDGRQTWGGVELLEKVLDKICRFLQQEFARRLVRDAASPDDARSS